jgi:hypothetical protein
MWKIEHIFTIIGMKFHEIFQGSALFEIVLLYTKNQRTVARDL